MTDNEFWKSLGICTRCHKRKAEPGKTQCLECNEKGYQRYRTVGMTDEQKKRASENQKMRYRQCKENGICFICKRKVENPKYSRCARCLAKKRKYDENKRQDISRFEYVSYGRCWVCGKPLYEGHKLCEDCYKRQFAVAEIMHNHPNTLKAREKMKKERGL